MKKWNQQYHDKFKAFALIHKVWDQKNLEKAWKRVKANRGSAGIDKITIEQFEQRQREDEETWDSYSERQSSSAGIEERT